MIVFGQRGEYMASRLVAAVLLGTEVAQAGEPATFGIRVSYKY